MNIHESAENYLETILILKNRKGFVRSIDIVNELGVTKPSVSRAMSLLRKDEYIYMGKDGLITLADKGRAIAEQIYERHRLLTEYLIALGVNEETAAKDACRIEHVISQESFERLKEHVQNGRPSGGQEPIKP